MTAPARAGVRPGWAHPFREHIARHNRRRMPFLREQLAAMAGRCGVDPAGVLSALELLWDESDPFEFDFAFPLERGGPARLEIGYNPHLRLSAALRDRIAALAARDGVGLDDLAPLYARFTPQWAETTVGVEWDARLPRPKLSVFAEGTARGRSADTLRADAEALLSAFGVTDFAPARALLARPLQIVAVDASARVDALRLLVTYPAADLAAAVNDIAAHLPPARRARVEAAAAIMARSAADHHLVYHKYARDGSLVQVKLYKTWPYPSGGGDATAAPPSGAHSPSGVPVRFAGSAADPSAPLAAPEPASPVALPAALAEIRALAALVDCPASAPPLVNLDAIAAAAHAAAQPLVPACLSMAFHLADPTRDYAVAYVSAGELPLHYM